MLGLYNRTRKIINYYVLNIRLLQKNACVKILFAVFGFTDVY